MKNFPTANYSSRVNEMKSKGGRGPRSHAASWTTCLNESVGTQWIFWMRNHFSCAALDTGDFDQWNAWTFLKFLLFFFFVRWKKKKAGENDEIGKWLRAFSRSETSGHRNATATVSFVGSLSLLALAGEKDWNLWSFYVVFLTARSSRSWKPKKLIENFFFFFFF